jgi:tetratricopeptide (TPR) repeat protein
VTAAVVLAATAAQVPGRAQNAITYDDLVAQYAGADRAAAALEISRWPHQKISSALAAYTALVPIPRQRAAVMLHTDAAYTLMVDGAPDTESMFHINSARKIFASARARSDAAVKQFERRWLAFAVSLYTSRTLMERAGLLLRDGLFLYPQDPRLYVAGGVLKETVTTLVPADPRSGNQLSRRDRVLDGAAADYRRAIERDDGLAVAHLRLGRVHFVQHDARARENLQAALSRAREPAELYLAHLFLGALYERENRVADAHVEYDAAYRIGPSCQSAVVALSRVEQRLGAIDRARTLVTAFAAIEQKADDPWINYRLGGFDQASLDWLRREAAAP